MYGDTWHVAIGSQVRLTEPWLLSMGFAYDSTPMSKFQRSPSLPLDQQFRFATGLQYAWNEDVDVGLNYEFLYLGEAEINQTGSPLKGTLQGDYSTDHINFINLYVSWKF